MGQYYVPVLKSSKDNIIKVYNRKVGTHTNFAKLMEHSWWDNSLLTSIGRKIYKTPGQIIWLGDYADDFELSDLTDNELKSVSDVQNKMYRHTLKESKFIFDNKYLCNHKRKLYVDLKEYYTLSVKDGWCPNPLSILCALGNGRGGGDYSGSDMNYVGAWAWESISIEDKPPKNYVVLKLKFIESY